MAVSDIYDTFFIDNSKEFRYVGCPDEATADKLRDQFTYAMNILQAKNNGKYIIQNDVSFDSL